MNIFIAIISLLILTTHVSAMESNTPCTTKTQQQPVIPLEETPEIDPIIHQIQQIKAEKVLSERNLLSDKLFQFLQQKSSDHTDKIINEIFFANPTKDEI
jgi:hypothetical protein